MEATMTGTSNDPSSLPEESAVVVEHDDAFFRGFLASQYDTVQRVVRAVARRHRLNAQEADELASLARYKLVDDGYRVLRRFRHQCSLATYLTTVVDRVYRDHKASEWGRWRASVQARRLGATAIRLERLVVRDLVPFDTACEILKTNCRAPESIDEMERMRAMFPKRRRPSIYELDAIENVGQLLIHTTPNTGERSRTLHLGPAVARALRTLPSNHRRLLGLRFQKGWTVAQIAREIQADQKATYRQFDRIYRRLRRAVESPTNVKSRVRTVKRVRTETTG